MDGCSEYDTLFFFYDGEWGCPGSHGFFPLHSHGGAGVTIDETTEHSEGCALGYISVTKNVFNRCHF